MYWCLQVNPLPTLTEMKFEFVFPVASELIPEHTSSDLKAVTPLLANDINNFLAMLTFLTAINF